MRHVFLLASIGFVAASDRVNAQTPEDVTGNTSDAATGLPVSGARIVIQAPPLDLLSLDDGTFGLRLPAGVYEAEASALGYTTRHLQFEVVAGESLMIAITLEPEPVALREIDVHLPARLRDPRLIGFWERRERGAGHFVTREEIEDQKSSRLVDVFRRVPGARGERIDAVGGGHVITLGRRAVMGFGQTYSICPAVIYIDGAEYTVTERGLDDIRAEEIEAIEVYSGPSRVPPQFNKTGSRRSRPGQVWTDPQCGVIVLWTRAR